MKQNKLAEKKWYNGAVIVSIGVVLYVVLTNLGTVLNAAGTFFGYFKTVFLGVVFAYVLNPVAKFFYYRVFRKMKLGNTRWTLSVALAFVSGLLLVLLMLLTLIPQLAESIIMLSENFDEYAIALMNLIQESPLASIIDMNSIETMSQNALTSISGFIRENAGSILGAAASSGKNIISAFLALIISIYLLLGKKSVLAGVRKLLAVFLKRETCEDMMDFGLRCDTILMSFLSQSLLDSLIVGVANAVFMLICRMQYVGLVSVVVGATNLIPNFGAVIGAVIGGFVLLLVNPAHALMFLVFCVVLQFIDGYILKPKLFSNSLGVSGLLILVSSIVLGNMFGVIGILLAIPAAAVLSFVYNDYFMPRQQTRKQNRNNNKGVSV